MVTKDEFYAALRALLLQNAHLQLRVAALQKTLEMKSVISEAWIEAQIAEMKTQDEYLRARAVIDTIKGPGEKSLEDILRSLEIPGPIQ